MGQIQVHPRVHQRHPEIKDEDAIAAWTMAIRSVARVWKDPDQYVAVGFDGRGRLLEIVAARDGVGDWVIFHALTPPTKATMRELGFA